MAKITTRAQYMTELRQALTDAKRLLDKLEHLSERNIEINADTESIGLDADRDHFDALTDAIKDLAEHDLIGWTVKP